MKTLLLGLLSAFVLAVVPAQASFADEPRARTHVDFGVSFGYPYYFYRPYRYYYPTYYYGFEIWPRYRGVRARAVRDRGDVRTRKLYVYPAGGQSAEQIGEDREQCHVWAVDATDFDPTLGAGTAEEADAYGRAFTACMEGRAYVVK